MPDLAQYATIKTSGYRQLYLRMISLEKHQLNPIGPYCVPCVQDHNFRNSFFRIDYLTGNWQGAFAQSPGPGQPADRLEYPVNRIP
jgi:hypothetical protein